MKQRLLKFINFFAKPFMGKGIDKKFPWLLTLYENVYVALVNPKKVVTKIPLDLDLIVDTKDSYLAMFLTTKGYYEPLETEKFIKSITKDATVIDVGANFGYYSMIAAKLAKKVISFEPDKENFQILSDNISLNKFNNVVAVNKAVAEVAGQVPFDSAIIHKGKSGVAADASKADYYVRSVTLDEFCYANKITQVDVIKLDIEGFEIKALKGATAILSKSKNLKVFVEFNPDSFIEFNYTFEDFFDVLEQINVVPVKIIDETRQKILDFSKEALEKTLKHSTFTNLYCESNHLNEV